MLGIYVHIPFCNGKCPYCDFYSLAGDDALKERYVQAVIRELREAHQPGMEADTLYFGGGTPTLLAPRQIGRIVEAARSLYGLRDAEITTEANPNTVSLPGLSELRESGLNRISFGVQSAVDRELQLLGRKHTAAQAEKAIDLARRAGFDNISADLMLGIPEQTSDSLQQSLDWIGRQKIQHVSAYLLKVEPSTPFFGNPVLKSCPDDDQAADAYDKTVRALSEMGFEQYEISNFAQRGFESRHNLKYWLCEEYLGIGAAAHSFVGGRRWGHGRDIGNYLRLGLRDVQFSDNRAGGLDERLMLGLRLNRGVDLAQMRREFLFDKHSLLRKAAEYQKYGLMNVEGDCISLTPKGFLLSNTILSDLIDFDGAVSRQAGKNML